MFSHDYSRVLKGYQMNKEGLIIQWEALLFTGFPDLFASSHLVRPKSSTLDFDDVGNNRFLCCILAPPELLKRRAITEMSTCLLKL